MDKKKNKKEPKKSIKNDEIKSDETNSFEKLLNLQSTLQEEVALKDIFYEDRESLLKKIENNCIDYYKMRISIQEIYDNKSQIASKNKIKYIFCDKPQGEIPQYHGHLSNLLLSHHIYQSRTIDLEDNINQKILLLLEQQIHLKMNKKKDVEL